MPGSVGLAIPRGSWLSWLSEAIRVRRVQDATGLATSTAWTQASLGKWYEGITQHHWTVLLVASLGWIFDAFEDQVYESSMNEAMPDLLPA